MCCILCVCILAHCKQSKRRVLFAGRIRHLRCLAGPDQRLVARLQQNIRKIHGVTPLEGQPHSPVGHAVLVGQERRLLLGNIVCDALSQLRHKGIAVVQKGALAGQLCKWADDEHAADDARDDWFWQQSEGAHENAEGNVDVRRKGNKLALPWVCSSPCCMVVLRLTILFL